eukprot:2894185-Rhodomonas_salina.1
MRSWSDNGSPPGGPARVSPGSAVHGMQSGSLWNAPGRKASTGPTWDCQRRGAKPDVGSIMRKVAHWQHANKADVSLSARCRVL